MRPNVIVDTLARFYELKRPILLEGSPGLGKTQIVQDFARQRNINFIHMHAPTMQPEDFAIPAPNAGRTAIDFLINSRFPIENSDHPEEGIILIDEAPQGDNSIQKTVANLTQEREIYGQRLKPGYMIVLTGNRTKDRAGANRILSHLRNRVTTIAFEASLDDWCNWAVKHDIKPELISFLRFKPALLNDFDPQQDISPTPRAWAEGVSPIIGNVPQHAEHECIAGAVGEGAAAEFMGYLKICRQLPDPDDVIKNPEKHAVPDEASVRYALTGALAHRADKNNFENVMKFMRRMPPEFAVMAVLDAIGRDSTLQNTKTFIDWAKDDGAKIILPS